MSTNATFTAWAEEEITDMMFLVKFTPEDKDGNNKGPYYITDCPEHEKVDAMGLGHKYEPRILKMPSFEQKLQSLLFGRSQMAWGEMQIANADGKYDDSIADIWVKGTIEAKVGSSTFASTDFKTLPNSYFKFVDADNGIVRLNVFDRQLEFLEKKIPTGSFTTSSYPDLPDSVIGAPVPLCFGDPLNASPQFVSAHATSEYTSTLNAEIDANDTDIVLTGGSYASWPDDGAMTKIGDELVFYETRTGSTLSDCIRGYALSGALAHAKGETVTLLKGMEYVMHDATNTTAMMEASLMSLALGYTIYKMGVFGGSSAMGSLDASLSTTATSVGFKSLDYTDIDSNNKYIYIDGEVIQWGSYVTSSATDGTFTGCTRGSNQTTATEHSENDVIYLNKDIDNSCTTILLTGAPGFGTSKHDNNTWTNIPGKDSYLQIDDEYISYGTRSGALCTGCGRHVAGTTATSHYCNTINVEGVGATVATVSFESGASFPYVEGSWKITIQDTGDIDTFREKVTENSVLNDCYFKINDEIIQIYSIDFDEVTALLGTVNTAFVKHRAQYSTIATLHGYNSKIEVESPALNAFKDNGVDWQRAISTQIVPGEGQYLFDKDRGKVYFGSSPVGTVTGNLRGCAFNTSKYNYWHRIAEYIITQFTDYTSANIHSGSLDWLDKAFPHRSGLYITEQRTVGEWLDELVVPFLGWYATNRDNELMIRKINCWSDASWATSGNFSSWVITNDMVLDYKVRPTPLYLNKVLFKWNKNNTPMTTSELADALMDMPPNIKEEFVKEYQTYLNDLSASRTGEANTVKSLLIDDSGATGTTDNPGVIATEWTDHWNTSRGLVDIWLKRYSYLISLGDKVTLTINRTNEDGAVTHPYGINAKEYQVIRTYDANNPGGKNELTLFGDLSYT